ncbi:hypothetical protein BLOT_000968 [Blomia tropicalis]|nr:hypothetical protein BLOT_000968 [Blomia tropicalis]
MTISLKKNNSVQFKHSKVFAQSTKRQRFKRPTWVFLMVIGIYKLKLNGRMIVCSFASFPVTKK